MNHIIEEFGKFYFGIIFQLSNIKQKGKNLHDPVKASTVEYL